MAELVGTYQNLLGAGSLLKYKTRMNVMKKTDSME